MRRRERGCDSYRSSFLSNAETAKFPETDQPILVPVWDEKAGKEVMKGNDH